MEALTHRQPRYRRIKQWPISIFRMLQQEKMAFIGQPAAGVAHEINNPLAFVISNLGALGEYVSEIRAFLRAQDETILIYVAILGRNRRPFE